METAMDTQGRMAPGDSKRQWRPGDSNDSGERTRILQREDAGVPWKGSRTTLFS